MYILISKCKKLQHGSCIKKIGQDYYVAKPR